MRRLLRFVVRLGILAAAAAAVKRLVEGSKPESGGDGWAPTALDRPVPVPDRGAVAAPDEVDAAEPAPPAAMAPADRKPAEPVPTKKAAAKKAPAKKQAAQKQQPTQKQPAQKQPAKKQPAKKPPAKKAAAPRADGGPQEE